APDERQRDFAQRGQFFPLLHEGALQELFAEINHSLEGRRPARTAGLPMDQVHISRGPGIVGVWVQRGRLGPGPQRIRLMWSRNPRNAIRSLRGRGGSRRARRPKDAIREQVAATSPEASGASHQAYSRRTLDVLQTRGAAR